jgi:hypothetical protein
LPQERGHLAYNFLDQEDHNIFRARYNPNPALANSNNKISSLNSEGSIVVIGGGGSGGAYNSNNGNSDVTDHSLSNNHLFQQ